MKDMDAGNVEKLSIDSRNGAEEITINQVVFISAARILSSMENLEKLLLEGKNDPPSIISTELKLRKQFAPQWL